MYHVFQAVSVFLGADSHVVTCAASHLPFLTASPAACWQLLRMCMCQMS